jgi:hypothetical protein
MKRRRTIIFFTAFYLLLITGNAQRAGFIYTPSPHFLQNHNVSPVYLPTEKNNLPVYRIEIVDNRFDTYKLGFHPEYKKAPREIRVSEPLTEVVKNIFNNGIGLDEKSDRKIIVVIQDCWITYHADSRYSVLKRNLNAELQYKIECFTNRDTSYYPLKRFSGNIQLAYNEDFTSQLLFDSLIHTLQAELPKLKIGDRENEKTLITGERLEKYITQKKSSIPRRYAYGVYASFEDFINQNAITDSIDIIPYKDYYERDVVAAHINIIKNGLVEPCTKYWGFYNGRYLFYNTGNGYFVRMFPVGGQFIFADLQQVALNSKKKSITSEALIGKSSYEIIRDYGNAFHLFFQLNFEDGKLY